MSDTKKYFQQISENMPKHPFPRPLLDERGKNDLPPGTTKGGEKMELDPKEVQIQQAFDSFCKKVLKHEAANGHRKINRRANMEISMSELPEEALEQLAVYDEYPWDYT
ncbi:MAG: sigma-70 family RNA polymerase sigma factor, partial [Clostridia bacterium]|nr:sigma-70 family RNA polymerase sigma factor [Clostridia bacterium]